MPFVILILAIIFLPVAPKIEYLHIVFVNTPVNQSTVDSTQRALDYWSAVKPANVSIGTVSTVAMSEQPINIIVNTFHTELTLYIISQQGPILSDGASIAHGVALPFEFAAVTTTVPIGNIETLIAHELGHLLYGLPELCGGNGSDVMCDPINAYPFRYGCATLAELGKPCYNQNLPLLAQ